MPIEVLAFFNELCGFCMYAYNETIQEDEIGIIGIDFFSSHHRHILHTYNNKKCKLLSQVKEELEWKRGIERGKRGEEEKD